MRAMRSLMAMISERSEGFEPVLNSASFSKDELCEGRKKSLTEYVPHILVAVWANAQRGSASGIPDFEHSWHEAMHTTEDPLFAEGKSAHFMVQFQTTMSLKKAESCHKHQHLKFGIHQKRVIS